MKKSLIPLAAVGIQLAGILTASAKLNVVATTPDLGAIGKAIGGDHVTVTALAKATEDPHFVDARPSFIVKLNRADALIEGGAYLEIGWLPALLDQARNAKLQRGSSRRIMASEGIQLLEIPTTLDRSEGDVHAAGNPHFTTDPAAVRIIARHVASVFCEIDGENCQDYRNNLETFTDRLDGKLKEWQEELAPYEGETVVAYHDSWPYFAQRFGLRIDLFLEPKPGIPPTPAHLAEVIQQMKSRKARVIIVQPYVSPRTAEVVAKHTGATVVEVVPYPENNQGEPGDYFEWMDRLVGSLAEALKANP